MMLKRADFFDKPALINRKTLKSCHSVQVLIKKQKYNKIRG